MENNQLIIISCLCGCKTHQPSIGPLVFHCTGISTLDFSHFQNTGLCRHFELWGLPVVACCVGWRRARFRCPPGDWGCQMGWSGGNRSKAEDYSCSHQSPACSQSVSQSAQASGPRIHQRGQGLTPRKMSSTLRTSGQIGAQCHRLAKHESSPFKKDKSDRKCVSI